MWICENKFPRLMKFLSNDLSHFNVEYVHSGVIVNTVNVQNTLSVNNLSSEKSPR